jgi:hypothetical protein
VPADAGPENIRQAILALGHHETRKEFGLTTIH